MEKNSSFAEILIMIWFGKMRKQIDIFISYRRLDSNGINIGTQLARTLKKEFENRKYKVFFDYSDCTDEDFERTIFPAIEKSRFFVLVLTKGSLDRCSNSNDWVRREIEQAIRCGCKIIPISPDSVFEEWPEDFPKELEVIKTIQISEINTGSLFEKSVDFVEENRIRPHTWLRWRNPTMEKVVLLSVSCLLAFAAIDAIRFFQCKTISDYESYNRTVGLWKKNARKKVMEIKRVLSTEIPKELQEEADFDVENITFEQALAIQQILKNMKFVQGGGFMKGQNPNDDFFVSIKEQPQHYDSVEDFWISKYEFSEQEYDLLMNKEASLSVNIPLVNVSWFDAENIVAILRDLTGLQFGLPTESQWEFAATARGLSQTRFSGSDIATEVAWCAEHPKVGNSRHRRNDSNAPMKCNHLDLFDMSGNVWEWCENNYYDYPNGEPEEARVIRGGSFRTETDMLTTTYRDPILSDESADDIGFRLIINIGVQ